MVSHFYVLTGSYIYVAIFRILILLLTRSEFHSKLDNAHLIKFYQKEPTSISLIISTENKNIPRENKYPAISPQESFIHSKILFIDYLH